TVDCRLSTRNTADRCAYRANAALVLLARAQVDHLQADQLAHGAGGLLVAGDPQLERAAVGGDRLAVDLEDHVGPGRAHPLGQLGAAEHGLETVAGRRPHHLLPAAALVGRRNVAAHHARIEAEVD